jgi:hemerythrin-like domain-containing protein
VRLREMIFEHDQERSLVEGLEDALYTKKGVEFVHFAHRLTALIRTHIYKEDTVLFAIAERCLSAAQDERVAAELEKFRIDSSILADLQTLQSAYLTKAA